MSKDEDYNWIDDPFDDKKNAQLQQKHMGTGAKVGIGIGCLGVVVLLVFLFMGLISAIAALA